MDNEEVNEKYLRSLFKNVRMHVDDHLTSGHIHDEDAHITFRCFLAGIHHKFRKVLEGLLLKQEEMHRKNNYDHIDDAVIPLLLKLAFMVSNSRACLSMVRVLVLQNCAIRQQTSVQAIRTIP